MGYHMNNTILYLYQCNEPYLYEDLHKLLYPLVLSVEGFVEQYCNAALQGYHLKVPTLIRT